MLFLWWALHVHENAKSFELALFVLTEVVCYDVQMFLLFYKLISWDHTLFINTQSTPHLGVKPDKYSLVPGFIHAPAGMHLWQFCTHGISRLGNKTKQTWGIELYLQALILYTAFVSCRAEIPVL